MKKLALLLTLGASAFSLHAAETVGTLQGVSGAVSVSGQKVVARAKDGLPLPEGAAVLVSSSGKATVVLNSGCVIALGANQHLTVNSKLPCEKTMASVKNLFPAYQVAQAPVGSGFTPPPPAAPFAATAGGGISTGAALGAFGALGLVGVTYGTNSVNDAPVSGQ